MTANGNFRAIGLMSGTSMDGVDLALIETDGETVSEFGPLGDRSYSEDERALLRDALAAARDMTDRADRKGVLGEAERMVTETHARALEAFLAATGFDASDIDVVGFHGQTVVHRPERGLTVQLGDGAALAARVGIDVVSDLRGADVAAGGEGAPLAPAYHRALALNAGLDLPVAFLNLGGVGNLTWIGDEADPLAFDTGPGNALIDDLVRRRRGEPYDAGGRIAAAGSVDEASLSDMMAHEFFLRRPPKSLDRGDFTASAVEHLSTEDAAATLAAFTAQSVAAATGHLPSPPGRWIVVGGGARNPVLMAELARRLDAPVEPAGEAGFAADHIEAQAFAFLAARSLKGLPLTFPGTTGVDRPITGGVLWRHP